MKRARPAFFAASILAVAIAVSPVLDRLADLSFAWHMVQHLLLVFVAPPLFLIGAPFELLAHRLSRTQAVALTKAVQTPFVRAVTSPPFCLTVYVFTLWLTHLTPLYEAALDHPPVHVAEHALFITAGVLFWIPVAAGPPLRPVSYPARLLYLFLAMPQCAFLAAALYNARVPLYPHYVRASSFVQALADQGNGAAVMWICGGLIVFAVMLSVVASWGYRERRSPEEVS